MSLTPHPADAITPRQRAVLDRLAAGHIPAWLVIYPDGMTATLQDQGGAEKHATGAHALKLPLVVPAEALLPCN